MDLTIWKLFATATWWGDNIRTKSDLRESKLRPHKFKIFSFKMVLKQIWQFISWLQMFLFYFIFFTSTITATATATLVSLISKTNEQTRLKFLFLHVLINLLCHLKAIKKNSPPKVNITTRLTAWKNTVSCVPTLTYWFRIRLNCLFLPASLHSISFFLETIKCVLMIWVVYPRMSTHSRSTIAHGHVVPITLLGTPDTVLLLIIKSKKIWL